MRVGPHVNTTHRAGVAVEYIRRVQPDAVKVLNSGMDGRVIAAAQAAGSLIIGRVYWDNQQLGAAYGRFIDRVIQFAREHPEIGWLEGANEFAQSPGELERYAEHEIERMKALDAIGRKAVIGNFSTGTPDVAHWSRFRPALEYAAAHGHALGLHSYSGPVMQWLAGGNQRTATGDVLADPCEGPDVDGWLTLRYRKVLKICRAWGIGHIKIAITESGIDDVQPRPGPQGKGWKSYLGTEFENRSPFGDYASQLAWYGRRLTEDQNVIAWVDFGFSQAGDWETFDLSNADAMRARVVVEMLKLPRGHGAVVPAPPPVTPPSPPPTPPEPPMNNVEAIIWAEVDKAHKLRGLPYTPSHALVAAAKIPAGVMLPTTDEIPVTSAGGRYIAQRFQRSDTGAVIVLYCRDGQWNKVFRIAPESGGGADVPPAAGPAFAWPIGSTAAARALPSIPPGWYVSVPFDQEYTVNGRAAVHPGLDISDVRGGDSDLGAPVYCMADGVVVASLYSAESWGNIVMVQHSGVPGYGTLWTQYAHLQARAVAEGDVVRQGQTVGTIGKGAGDRFAAHLHLEVRRMDLPATAWPGNSHGRVIAGYLDPRDIIGRVL